MTEPVALDPVTGLDLTAKLALDALAEAHDAKAWDKAAALGDAWIEARNEMPLLAGILYAQSLMGVGRYRDALPWARAASMKMPEEETTAATAAHSCYAQALARTGDYTGARRALKRMVTVPATHPEALEKQGHVLMATSNKWKQGWALHESRLVGKQLPLNTRLWDGVTKESGGIHVLHEQGIGDAVLFARWLPWIEQRFGQPIWYGPEILHRWIEELGYPIGGTVDTDIPRDSAVVYAMSLPAHAQCYSPLSVPKPLAPDGLLSARAYRRQTGTVRVGVCWQGAKRGWHDFERSFTVEQFAPVVEPVDGVEFVNLAHDAVDTGRLVPVHFSDVLETGEAIAACDLVVSVDTSVVHLAGSIGVPTLAIVPTVPDWRYEWPYSSRSPFYRSVTVCRRKHGHDLSPLRVARAMVERFARAVQAA